MSEKPLILAVDDEQDFLEIATTYLESSGFRAATLQATGVEELLQRCEEVRPALALLDVYVGAQPLGLEFTAALKGNPNTAHIKVILWSSASEPEGNLADDFFNKGEDLKVLVDKILQHLPVEASI